MGIFSWLGMAFTDLTILFSNTNGIDPGIEDYVPHVFYVLYVVSLFVFFKYRVEKAESVNFIDLLWKIFVTGLVTTIGSLILKSFDLLLGSGKLTEDFLYIDFSYLINLGLVTAFIVSTFIVWKRLILYNKSKFLLKTWAIFEYALLASLLLDFFTVVTGYYYYIAVAILGIVLSANMKWVAYLNFKQKWKSILLLVLALLYLGYFFMTITALTSEPKFNMVVGDSIFIQAAFTFIFIYAIFSLLVLLVQLAHDLCV